MIIPNSTTIEVRHKTEIEVLFSYLEDYIKYRLDIELRKENTQLPKLRLESVESQLALFINKNRLSEAEVLLLSLIHI